MNTKMWTKMRVAAVALLATMAGASHAGTYYVATNGSAEGDGSYAKPWPSVAVALDKVGGGNTIVLKPGVYVGPVTVYMKHQGTEQHPTIIKSEKKWKAIIIGGGFGHGIGDDMGCPWVVFDGFEAFGASDGISLNGDHNTARNCWTHNNWAMGIGSHSRKGNVIENNLIEYNGQHPHLHHGVYADGEDLLVHNNIIRNNAGFGLHLYPSMKKAVVANNLIYGHQYESGITLFSPWGGGRNLIVNNTVVGNARGIDITHGKGEKLYNNIVMAKEPAIVFNTSKDTASILADYNLCVPTSPLQGQHGLSVDPGFVKPHLMCYWLRADSPARGKGTAEFAPKTDFWGRTRPADKAPDLGAFAYSRYWASDEAMKTLPNTFPNRFTQGQAEWELPDLWLLPNEPGVTTGARLGIDGTSFTLNGKKEFLLGASYYGALGAPEEFVAPDLDDLKMLGFNWIRVFAAWNAFDDDVSAVDAEGKAREPYLSKLKAIIAAAGKRAIVVDVTLARGDAPNPSNQAAHLRAVETLARELKEYRNVYFDLANERDQPPAHVSYTELKALRDRVKAIDPDRLVTASGAPKDQKDMARYLLESQLDFISPHLERDVGAERRTADVTREYLGWMEKLGRVAPIHYQEPFRRDYFDSRGYWQPEIEHFCTDLRNAKLGGAAGWCFHNGSPSPPEKFPQGKRRSFDMRPSQGRLMDQLDAVEKEFLKCAAGCLKLAKGPLHVCPENPRYFANGTGKAIAKAAGGS